MVFPISDDNSDLTTVPVVNWILIAVNVLVFLIPQGLGTNEEFTYEFSCVPQRIVTGDNTPIQTPGLRDPYTGETAPGPVIPPAPVSPYLTLLTSMFLHGGLAHIFGNMLFLYIFGDNIEDTLGHGLYLAFYLVCGVAASLAHVAATALGRGEMSVPSLGASGAISGVLGAYIVLFPTRRVTVILFRFLTDVPAWVALGIWFGFQLISGLGILGEGSQAGGVAFWAHIGGFAAGAALIFPLSIGRPRPPSVSSRPPPWSYG
jgi:membrane associated rhomboid family serine protease